MDSLNESSNASLLIKTCATADGICKPPEQPTDIRCQHRFWRNKTQSRMGIRNSEHLLLCGRRCAHFQEKRFPWIPQQHKRAQQAFEAQRGTLQNSWWDVPPSSANLNPDSSSDLRAILQTRFQTWPIKFQSKNLTVFRYVFWKFFSIYPLPCPREVNILFTHFLLCSTVWYWTSCKAIVLYALMDPLKTIPNFSPTMVIQYSNHRYCTSSWRTAVGTTEDRGRLPGTTKLA